MDGASTVPDIIEGEIEEIIMSGVAHRRGHYCIVINGSAESGYLTRHIFGDSPFHNALTVRVWADLGLIVRPLVHDDTERCWYEIVASPGVAFPEGEGLSAEIANIPETFELITAAAEEFSAALSGSSSAADACQKANNRWIDVLKRAGHLG